MPNSSHAPKAKITVTLSPDIVRQLDARLNASETRSRSQLVEEALRRWLEERLQKDIDRQTEEYYCSLSSTELKEDQEWSAIAAESAKHVWKE